MRLIGINQLKSGEKLAYPIYSTSGKVVLGTGSIITEAYKNRLKDMGIRNLYIDDERFADIEVIEVVSFETRKQVNVAFRQCHDLVHKGKPLNEYILVDAVKHVVEDIKSNNNTSICLLPNMAVDDYLTGHSVNVCILSVMVGNNMDYNFSQLVDLGVGALIHDIARKDDSKETPEHVKKGFEIMKNYCGISLYSSKAIFEHHENYDGSGYPRSIRGENISIYSRIVSIADFFDGLTSVGEVKVPPHEAFEALLAESDKRFDPEIVEIFRKSVPFYPNGCMVKLSDGKMGVIVGQNPGTPQRPVVRILEGEDVTKDINLIANLTLFIEDIEV